MTAVRLKPRPSGLAFSTLPLSHCAPNTFILMDMKIVAFLRIFVWLNWPYAVSVLSRFCKHLAEEEGAGLFLVVM